MIRVLILDLGETLVSDGRKLPNVEEALDAFSGFVTAEGNPLAVCLVSDWRPAFETDQIGPLFEEYLVLLEDFGLRDYFEPVSERVTLSTHAGTEKPDRRVFVKALERLDCDANFGECLFITENRDHIEASRSLGMKALRFDQAGAEGADFSNWAEAPRLVEAMIGGDSRVNRGQTLHAELATLEDIRLLSLVDDPGGGRIRGRAEAWCSLTDSNLGELDGVSVRLPVDVEIELDKQGKIVSVSRADPPSEVRAEAINYVVSLSENRQITLQADDESATPGTTHRLDVDPEGNCRLRRLGFSEKLAQ